MKKILHISLPVCTLWGCQAITRLHEWVYHLLYITGSQQNRKWRCLEISRLADEICLTGSKVRDLKVCQPNVEMHCIQNYDSDSSDGEDEKQETTDDLTAHLKPLDPDKKSITTIALNAAPVIATKASLGI